MVDKIKDGLKLDRNILQELVIGQGLTPEEIAEVYGRKENNFFIYPPDEILERMREYKISPSFIKGMDLIDEMKRNIRSYENTIREYSKGSKARYRKYESILNKIVKMNESVKDNKEKKELESLIDSLLNSGITFKEMIDIQQKDEGLRLKYFKLKQDEVNNMMKAIDVQTKALEIENILATMYAELAIIDDANSSNYAPSFLASVKKKTMEKVANDTTLTHHIEDKEEYIKRVTKKSRKSIKSKGILVGLRRRNNYIEEIAEKYNVHWQVANLAWGYHIQSIKRKQEREIPDCVKEAIEKAYKIYKYLDKKGQKFKK